VWNLLIYSLFAALPVEDFLSVLSSGGGNSPITFSETRAPSVFVSTRQDETQILVNLRADGLFTRDIVDGINRGFTSSVEYTVDLWWDRKGWVDQLVQRKKITFFIIYDLWTRKYEVRDAYGDVTSYADFERVVYEVCMQDNISLSTVDVLDRRKTYCATAKVVLKPLLTEDLKDMGRYARGEMEEVKKKEKLDIFFHLLKQARNLAGLGDKVVTGRSKLFRLK
jgi:hypothetical protein